MNNDNIRKSKRSITEILFNKSMIRKVLFAIYDLITILLSSYLAYLLSNKHSLDFPSNSTIHLYVSIFAIVSIIIYLLLGLYSNVLKYASVTELSHILLAVTVVLFANIFVSTIFDLMPIRWVINTYLLCLIFACVIRFINRIFVYYKYKFPLFSKKYRTFDRVLIVGAGDAARILIREIEKNLELKMRVVCAVDDDSKKFGLRIEGIKVMGTRDDIEYLVKKYSISLIIIAMPSVEKHEIAKILEKCGETKVKIKLIPGLFQLVNGCVSVSDIKDVGVEDLLGREQVKINLKEVMDYVSSKVVLVTGGGGSIGSELCRQIAQYSPKLLIIFDIYENNAYDIEQELRRKYPHLNLLVLIGSVRDHIKINDVFDKYHPEIVYHAAAHKHVPLMETSPNEAVKNNVIGTYKVAKAAGEAGCKRFILISTDKAVNPTNIMGATKRICEMIVQTLNKKYDTEYVAVRFGNVLGSNGSVIPLFKRQIKEGGPVTVTHKDITRFFMTIPEAVSLVLQAGAYALGGEIFILDMGEPVKIYDLALKLIRLSGFTPGVDMKIEVTGLRPGEKLYEEILMKEEGLKETPNHLIHIGKPIELDEDKLFTYLDMLYKEAYSECDNMKELVSELVPTYHISN